MSFYGVGRLSLRDGVVGACALARGGCGVVGTVAPAGGWGGVPWYPGSASSDPRTPIRPGASHPGGRALTLITSLQYKLLGRSTRPHASSAALREQLAAYLLSRVARGTACATASLAGHAHSTVTMRCPHRVEPGMRSDRMPLGLVMLEYIFQNPFSKTPFFGDVAKLDVRDGVCCMCPEECKNNAVLICLLLFVE